MHSIPTSRFHCRLTSIRIGFRSRYFRGVLPAVWFSSGATDVRWRGQLLRFIVILFAFSLLFRDEILPAQQPLADRENYAAAAAETTASNGVKIKWEFVRPADVSIPQLLLPLLHSEEVQSELELDAADRQKLEQLFAEIDGAWIRTRNISESERRETIAKLEQQLLVGLTTWMPAEKIERLRQLELQGQAGRMLLRGDVASALQLNPGQQSKLQDGVATTDALIKEIAEAAKSGSPLADAVEKVSTASREEYTAAFKLLDDDQKRKLNLLLGQSMDLSALSRVQPMAPELIVTDGWVGTPPGRLADLRGKVVIVHFYAFQCINCQRNLPRYNEWVDQFSRDDVVLIGIQTPETASERDANKVQSAAKENQMEYPVLLDLQSKNWQAWSNTMWPTVYVVDQNGYVRYWWQGELNWEGATGDKRVTEIVQDLLDNPNN